MLIKCSFCEADYEGDEGHSCNGNSIAPRYRRPGARKATPPEADGPNGYAHDLLTDELAKLVGERAEVEADYQAYVLVHEPMVASLVAALGKI